jgi:FAD binding domain
MRGPISRASNHFDAGRVDAFLANAGAMVSFFEENTEVKFAFGKDYPDYHPDHPGGAEQGRSIHALPFDGRKLGRDLALLAQPMAESTFMGMGLNSGPDLKHFLNATRSVRSALFVSSRLLAHGRDILLHGRGTRLVNGNALAARLLKTVLDRKIVIWPSTKAVSLDKAENRIVGAVVEKEAGQRVLIKARLGVVLAGGGFPGDDDLRKQHFQHVKAGARHATLAAEGSDPDFAPNPCVGEIAKPPFYAVKIIPGDIGTYHGLVTDERTRVLDGEGNPIDGLFAVGNDAASIFGGSYPGAGATLGPAMTFGYICGTYLAGEAANPPPP